MVLKYKENLYSAFLIKHVNDNLCTINQGECERDFKNFKILHDKEIERLNSCEIKQGLKNVI
jgi:hypothetical protein